MRGSRSCLICLPLPPFSYALTSIFIFYSLSVLITHLVKAAFPLQPLKKAQLSAAAAAAAANANAMY